MQLNMSNLEYSEHVVSVSHLEVEGRAGSEVRGARLLARLARGRTREVSTPKNNKPRLVELLKRVHWIETFKKMGFG
jgi:hypothetical protein